MRFDGGVPANDERWVVTSICVSSNIRTRPMIYAANIFEILVIFIAGHAMNERGSC